MEGKVEVAEQVSRDHPLRTSGLEHDTPASFCWMLFLTGLLALMSKEHWKDNASTQQCEALGCGAKFTLTSASSPPVGGCLTFLSPDAVGCARFEWVAALALCPRQGGGITAEAAVAFSATGAAIG